METECSFLDYSFINFATSESLLTTSQYAKVIFHNVEEKYSCSQDLVCQYSLTEQFYAKSGDRIVLFKLGWQQVTEYVLFEWASLPQECSTLQVKLKADSLPRDTTEFYQFCYISCENAVCGASIPFQFTINTTENLVTSTDSDFVSLQMNSLKTLTSTSSLEPDTTLKPTSIISPLNVEIAEDVSKLKEENKQLQNELLKTNASLQRCDGQINCLQREINSLKELLLVTQNDVSDVKMRMDLASDEYKKLFAEKTRVEKKYEKLVKKCKGKKNSESSSDLSCDYLGELDPLPPFPLLM